MNIDATLVAIFRIKGRRQLQFQVQVNSGPYMNWGPGDFATNWWIRDMNDL